MVRLGHTLIVLGFLAGAYAATTDPVTVAWPFFAACLVVGIVGITLVRGAKKKHAHSDSVLTNNIEIIGLSLTELANHADQLERDNESIFVYDMHSKIDELFPEPLDQFVQARETIIHAFSLNDYADVMNHFAAGERGINRAWSASVDGYVDEVKISVEKAARHFRDALTSFQSLKPSS